ncbi:hypothetical protein [Agarivorans sp. 1_MG-2023]|uniref:hypothetical protein n=1 Tax=Agarivorans sp. 1_MG-2023 TaxID=3062634 RepID=UPI0026E27B0D|nr:hypothetical protein [Agarivorans sp. 1_MG-2023]MDO6763863.1 hypothetical protein [Agarivorans sp. 1_MG-2023]
MPSSSSFTRMMDPLVTLESLPGISQGDIAALRQIDIFSVSDLLHFKPVHYAQILKAYSQGLINHHIERAAYLKDEFAAVEVAAVGYLPPNSLRELSARSAQILESFFGIVSINELAEFGLYHAAQRYLTQPEQGFDEAPSAPDELMPGMIGSTHSSVRFSSYVKGQRYQLQGLRIDAQTTDNSFAGLLMSDSVSALMEQKPPLSFYLGYIVHLKQYWRNMGTHLGEVIHSLALAPGESRNIAVIDWYRKQSSSRGETTRIDEQLSNSMTHTRALDEVTQATALEHQRGQTNSEASTSSVGTGLSAGVGGGRSDGGNASGTLPLKELTGIPMDLDLSAASILSSAGGAGGSAVFSHVAQEGVVQTETNSTRQLVSELQQNITDRSVQNASSMRSIRSSVVVTDEQQESEQITTRNVTNYNHMHALTVQYFEVLQKYQVEIDTLDYTPIMYLPYRPITFDFEFIRAHWRVLQALVKQDSARLYQRFASIIERPDYSTEVIDISSDLSVTAITAHIVTLEDSHWALIYRNSSSVEHRVTGLGPKISRDVDFSGRDRIRLDDLVSLEVTAVLPPVAGSPDLSHIQFIKAELDMTIVDEGANETKVSLSVPYTLLARDSKVLFSDLKSEVISALEQQASIVPLDYIKEIELFFNRQRYAATRLLIFSTEREQLSAVLESLHIQSALHPPLPLMELASATPVGFTENFIILKLHQSEQQAAEQSLVLSEAVSTVHGKDQQASFNRPLSGRLKVRKQGECCQIEIELMSSAERSSDDIIAEITLQLHGQGPSYQGSGFIREPSPDGELSISLHKVSLDWQDTKFELYSEFLNQGKVTHYDLEGVISPAVAEPHPLRSSIDCYLRTLRSSFVDLIGQQRVTDTIYLPSAGVFGEAILGRANSAEKIDASRYFNWQDSLIPHTASEIAAIQAGSRDSGISDMNATVTDGNLSIMPPTPLPNSQTAAATLAALGTPGLFRDASGSALLSSTLSTLAEVALQTAQHAGTLAGDARSDALNSAVSLGQQVSDVLASVNSKPSGPIANPSNVTEAGAGINQGLGINNSNQNAFNGENSSQNNNHNQNDNAANNETNVATGASAGANAGAGSSSGGGSGGSGGSSGGSGHGGTQTEIVNVTLRGFVPSQLWALSNAFDINEMSVTSVASTLVDMKDFITTLISEGWDKAVAKSELGNTECADLLRAIFRFEGDDREFSEGDAQGIGSMFELSVQVKLNRATGEIRQVTEQNKAFGTPGLYTQLDSTGNVGDVWWAEGKETDATVFDKTDVNLGDKSLLELGANGRILTLAVLGARPYAPYDGASFGEMKSTIKLGDYVDFELPLKDVFTAVVDRIGLGSVHALFEVSFNWEHGQLKVSVAAEHQYFPCYEVIVDYAGESTSVYTFDARQHGQGPSSLSRSKQSQEGKVTRL